ncbi:cuticle protein 16.5 [Nilaparvata lugens]|uniref:cuticle protein 16.5 n=1 Tax=Nilaparvata lugens TaxID=108931 RepID=UPI00193DD9EE|nr:cuticle protein 16.5 [Nilaparvata lugens]
MKVLIALCAVVACAVAGAVPVYPYAAAGVYPYTAGVYPYSAYPYSAYPYSAYSHGAYPYAAPWAYKSYALPVVTPSGYLADTPEVAAAKVAHFAEHAAAHARGKRSVTPVITPAATTPLLAATAPVLSYAAAPAVYPYSAYAAHYAPSIYSAAPAVYGAHLAAPAVYSAPVVPAVAPAVRAATLTTIVNTPGHAVSYRVD